MLYAAVNLIDQISTETVRNGIIITVLQPLWTMDQYMFCDLHQLIGNQYKELNFHDTVKLGFACINLISAVAAVILIDVFKPGCSEQEK